MAISLPDPSWLATAKLRYIDFAVDQAPAMGGPGQRISRLGSRYGFDITLPRLDTDSARAWNAARKKARVLGSTLIMSLPKRPPPGALGSPLVNGASQAGANLICKSFTAGATIKADQPFSVVVGGISYLYYTTDQVTADGAGAATLPIAPILRASPANNAALQFAAPQIEGFIPGTTEEWDLDVLQTVGIAFSFQENQ